MRGFENAWLAVALSPKYGAVAPRLKPLLQDVYSSIQSTPLNLPTLKEGLEHLLTFLAGEGRTNANCWATDLFFMSSEGWERDWSELKLPEDFQEVLARIGEALHDTVQAPEVAANFGCLPEQILDLVRRLQV
jgi:hypothetical protein